jgi:hypothetical protein
MGACFSSPNTGPAADSAARDPISQGLDNAQQAIGLIDGIFKIVQPQVLEARNKRDETNHLKKVIGPWWKQAFEHGACMIPVLDVDDFEKYLQRKDGQLHPQGNCVAISPWARLLHALAITPTEQVLTWKPASGTSSEVHNGMLAMDLRGAAFCHLINLYRMNDPGDEGFSVEGDRQNEGRCRLFFGWGTWKVGLTGHIIATFEPDSIPKFDGPKVPFNKFGIMPPPSQEAGLWESYKGAVKRGTSDVKLDWPSPSTSSLLKRMEHFVTNLDEVKYRRTRLILTKGCFAEAARIKRRVMTNGGKDKSFLKDVYKTLAQHPLRHELTSDANTDIQNELKQLFFFEGDNLDLRTRPVYQRSAPYLSILSPGKVLRATLDSYSTEASSSWKGQMHASKDLVYKVAFTDRVIVLREDVRVLDFGPGDPLWSARVHL